MRNFNENYSLVRILNALVDGNEVDVYLDEFPFYSGIQFAEFTPYVYVPEGEYTFSVYLKDERETPLAQTTIKVTPDKLITSAIVNRDGVIEIMPIPEQKGAPSGNNSKIKFVQLVPKSPSINILLNGEEIFSDVYYLEYTDYKEVESGEYKMDIEISENEKIAITNRIILNVGKTYTFYAIGAVPNIDVIQTLDGATFIN